jgi:hypothetical protein
MKEPCEKSSKSIKLENVEGEMGTAFFWEWALEMIVLGSVVVCGSVALTCDLI